MPAEKKESTEQNLRWCGLLIRACRLRRGWSQESVCHGICAVSTLSKIESGASTGSWEMIRLLALRLDMPLPVSSLACQAQEESLFSLLQQGRTAQMKELFQTVQQKREQEPAGLSLNMALLSCLIHSQKGAGEILEEAWPFMDSRQKALLSLLKHSWDQAAALLPEAWLVLLCSWQMYTAGEPETEVLQKAQQAYDLAADAGEVYLMGLISHHQGIVCSNTEESGRAWKYLQRAEKIFSVLQEKEDLDQLDYNEACLLMQEGRFAQAAERFACMRNLDAFMPLHKLAVCFEQTGEWEKAAETLARACQAPDPDWPTAQRVQMAEVLRSRLQKADWVHDAEYGKQLLQLFETLQAQEVHKGFAQFYLPWVVQYLKANRQYARLVQILEDFPGKPLFVPSQQGRSV